MVGFKPRKPTRRKLGYCRNSKGFSFLLQGVHQFFSICYSVKQQNRPDSAEITVKITFCRNDPNCPFDMLIGQKFMQNKISKIANKKTYGTPCRPVNLQLFLCNLPCPFSNPLCFNEFSQFKRVSIQSLALFRHFIRHSKLSAFFRHAFYCSKFLSNSSKFRNSQALVGYGIGFVCLFWNFYSNRNRRKAENDGLCGH